MKSTIELFNRIMIGYNKNQWWGLETRDNVMKKKLLIIEDAPEMVDLLKWRAARHQFDCVVDETGASWADQVRQEKPDAVILDMNLPLMGGFGILREFRNSKDLPQIPIFVLSGVIDQDVEDEALSLGATAYFHKSEDIDGILKKVKDRVHTPL